MTDYARIVGGAFDRVVSLTQDEYAALVANGKAAHLRLWVVNPRPTPAASEVVEQGPIVITETHATQTWTVRAKTAAELEAEEVEAERVQLRQLIVGLAGSVANPDVSGTAAERIVKLEVRMRRIERVGLWVLRRFTTGEEMALAGGKR